MSAVQKDLIEKGFIAEKLRDVLSLRKMTAIELGKRVYFSRQQIFNYLSGHALPSRETVESFSKILNVPYEFFTIPYYISNSLKEKSFTYIRNMPINKAFQAKVKILSEIFVALAVDCIDFLAIGFPHLSNNPAMKNFYKLEGLIQIKEINKIAQEARKTLGLDDGPINDLQHILEYNGFILSSDYSEREQSYFNSVLVKLEKYNLPVILLTAPEKDKKELQYKLAFELGHLILHEGNPAIREENYITYKEEAELFANCFLMPIDSYSRDIDNYERDNSNYFWMSEKWNVPYRYTYNHAVKLELVDRNHIRNRPSELAKEEKYISFFADKEAPGKLSKTILQFAIESAMNELDLEIEDILDILKKGGVYLYPKEINNLLGFNS